MNHLIGRTLDQYEVIEQIGQGGMATVFKAYQPGLDRFVALKILPPTLAQQPGFTNRFVREAKAIARLNHPNILPVFDFGHLDGISFLAMRYIDRAQTLRDVMTQQLTLKQMAGFIGQVAEALDHAHQQRIIHRDVKPANVLMDGEWALLGDFGLSKMMDSSIKLTGTGMSMGTPAYMSPEQGRGEKVDHRTDIYALGIILFEMLTGQIPHQADTPLGLLLKRLSEPLPPPRSLNPAIPEGVERVVVKALAFEPAERFERATEMAQSLQAVVNQAPATEEMTLFSSKDTPLLAPTFPSPLPRQAVASSRQGLGGLFGGGQAESQGERNRQAMLKLVHDFWIKGVLEQSLHGAAWLELGLIEQAEAVEQPWEMVVQTAKVPALSIPPGMPMSEVFAAMSEALLILGEPGSGKTTMLLELARQKLDEAVADPGQTMPVVFNLSSWQSGQPLAEWLVDELRAKYNIPKKIAQPWVENDALLLLLDGLDEVVAERRENCVEAINEFRQEHLVPMVVCSRVADYELLTTKLKLQGAVLIQPLVHRQVEVYLNQAGPELAALRGLIDTDETLQELTRSPLLLSIMALAYHGKSVEELSQFESVEARRQHLFETYTEQMFQRRGVDTRYSPADTKQWLTWIAQKMQEHGQSVCLIERLQPSWLSTQSEQRLFVGATGLIVGLPPGLILGLASGRVDTFLIFSVLGGMMGGLCGLAVIILKSTPWVGSLRWSWLKQAVSPAAGFISIFPIGLILGSLFQLVLFLIVQPDDMTITSMLFSIIGLGLVVGFILGMIGMMMGAFIGDIDKIVPVDGVRWSWGKAGKGVGIGLIIALTCGLLSSLFVGLHSFSQGAPICEGFQEGLECGLFSGLMVASFLAYFCGLIGLLNGLRVVKIETTTRPNQGIRQSARNALIGVLGGGLAVGIGTLPLHQSMFGLMIIGLIFGFIGWVSLGGRAIVQHFTLRFILWRNGDLPWNLAHFLDYAAERIFLRKVGGGYIFVHRLVLEHFSSLDKAKEAG